jgi:ribonuclease-3
VARDLGLDARLVAQGLEGGHGDVAELARQQSVLAALVEAAIGAVYLARGFDAVREAVVAAFAGRLQAAADERFDHKTDLQEALQRQGRSVQYEVVDVSGPPHRRAFVSVARVDGTELGRGGGSSKKASEQEAARVALAALAAGAA